MAMVATITHSAQEIELQVQRIIQSSSFRNSPVLIRFLEFIVSETLQERGASLKEYTIALNVLKRPKDFDPQDDAVIRIHAGRMRRALNIYYLAEGYNDPILIEVPKGCYVPKFEAKQAEFVERPSSFPLGKSAKPVIAVFPFKSASDFVRVNHEGATLEVEIAEEIARFQRLSVISYFSSEFLNQINDNVMDASKLIGADYVLAGRLHRYQDLDHARVYLLNTANGELLLVKSFEWPSQSSYELEMPKEIAECVVTMVENQSVD